MPEKDVQSQYTKELIQEKSKAFSILPFKRVFQKLLGNRSNDISRSMHCRRNNIRTLLEAIHWSKVTNHQTQRKTNDELDISVIPLPKFPKKFI